MTSITDNKNKKTSYFNTLMFTIFASVLSLSLLAMLFFDIGREFLPFLITFEVGIFFIIGLCIYRIYAYEASKKKSKENSAHMVKFDQCPDYYVKRKASNGKDYCFNDYTVRDANGNYYIMKVYPTEVNGRPVEVPSSIQVSNGVAGGDYLHEKFPLNALNEDPKLKTVEEKCQLLFHTPPSQAAKYGHLPAVPWDYARSRCQPFVEGS